MESREEGGRSYKTGGLEGSQKRKARKSEEKSSAGKGTEERAARKAVTYRYTLRDSCGGYGRMESSESLEKKFFKTRGLEKKGEKNRARAE